MPRTFALHPLSFHSTSKLHELLELLAALRALDQPLQTAAGLRAGLELLLRLAEFVGLDRTWSDRVREILTNPRVFDVVLALVRYFGALVSLPGDATAAQFDASTPGRRPVSTLAGADEVVETIDAQALVDWLPVVLQIIELWKRLRGAV
ncbi:MAG: hypothetical protein SGJ20_14240 [Planctomycetota bacterium]|nr:hypothetical protein [Planctomycetota bacterium]